MRNPLSEEEPALRTTLLPGLLATLARNLGRGQRDLGALRARRGLPARRHGAAAPLPGVDRRPDDETLAALLGAVPEQPWHVGRRADRLPRAARLVGPGPPGRPGPTPCEAARAGRRRRRRRADRAGRGAGAVAPGPLRRAAGRRRRWSGTPASCTRGCARRWSCPPRTSVMELDLDALPAAAGAGRPARSRRSRRCCIDLALVVRRRAAPRPTSAPRCAQGPGSCWSRCGCSTSTPVRRCRRGAAVAGLRADASARRTGRSPARRRPAVRDAAVAAAAAATRARCSVAELTGRSRWSPGRPPGIGRHLVEGLAARGMAVAGLARGADRLTAAMAEVAAATGARTLAVAADVTDRAAVRGRRRAGRPTSSGRSTCWSTTPG